MFSKAAMEYLETACKDGNHLWAITGYPYFIKGENIPEGVPCDCGKVTWHTEESCPHCHSMVFKPLPREFKDEI